jgi:hypothetical protein
MLLSFGDGDNYSVATRNGDFDTGVGSLLLYAASVG